MALTVPPPSSSISEFGWIFHNTHLDSSIYQDEDIMDFSDNSADYQTPPHQATTQPQQQVSICLSKSSSHCLSRNLMWCCSHYLFVASLSRPSVCLFLRLFDKKATQSFNLTQQRLKIKRCPYVVHAYFPLAENVFNNKTNEGKARRFAELTRPSEIIFSSNFKFMKIKRLASTSPTGIIKIEFSPRPRYHRRLGERRNDRRQRRLSLTVTFLMMRLDLFCLPIDFVSWFWEMKI